MYGAVFLPLFWLSLCSLLHGVRFCFKVVNGANLEHVFVFLAFFARLCKDEDIRENVTIHQHIILLKSRMYFKTATNAAICLGAPTCQMLLWSFNVNGANLDQLTL